MSRVPRAAHIGSKATTPSVESRERSSLRGGAVSRARKEAVETPAQRWATQVDGVLERLKSVLAGRDTAHCQAERSTGEGHTHGCTDFEDHSAGCHVCECGQMWRSRGAAT